MSFIDKIVDILDLIISTASGWVWGWPDALPLIVILLLGTGILTTFRLGWVQVRRFRHGVKFQRWRPDRDPISCRYDQLDVARPVRFDELLAEPG